MRNADGVGHTPRVVDVLAGAAGLGPPHRLAVVVELERDPDDVIAGLGQERGRHRAVDAAGHGDDDAAILPRWASFGNAGPSAVTLFGPGSEDSRLK